MHLHFAQDFRLLLEKLIQLQLFVSEYSQSVGLQLTPLILSMNLFSLDDLSLYSWSFFFDIIAEFAPLEEIMSPLRQAEIRSNRNLRNPIKVCIRFVVLVQIFILIH